MPPGTERWNRGRKKWRGRTLRRLLILCEDTKSSRDYLKQFPYDAAQVAIECVGTGMNTDSLMEEAIRRKEAAEEAKAPYESVWVVFDKDDFSLQNFNRTFDLARAHPTIRACWSNECFELWYLLHFKLRTTGIGRKEMWRELEAHLGKRYEKADQDVFAKLKPKLGEAIRNAYRLAFQNAQIKEERRNPSTNVHELIKELQKHDPGRLQQ